MSKVADPTLHRPEALGAATTPDAEPPTVPAEPEIGGVPRFVAIWMAIFVLGGILCVISLLMR